MNTVDRERTVFEVQLADAKRKLGYALDRLRYLKESMDRDKLKENITDALAVLDNMEEPDLELARDIILAVESIPAEEPSYARVKCSQCGTLNREGSDNCSHCLSPLEPPTYGHSPEEPREGEELCRCEREPIVWVVVAGRGELQWVCPDCKKVYGQWKPPEEPGEGALTPMWCHQVNSSGPCAGSMCHNWDPTEPNGCEYNRPPPPEEPREGK